jgi:hypothetical protein
MAGLGSGSGASLDVGCRGAVQRCLDLPMAVWAGVQWLAQIGASTAPLDRSSTHDSAPRGLDRLRIYDELQGHGCSRSVAWGMLIRGSPSGGSPTRGCSAGRTWSKAPYTGANRTSLAGPRGSTDGGQMKDSTSSDAPSRRGQETEATTEVALSIVDRKGFRSALKRVSGVR